MVLLNQESETAGATTADGFQRLLARLGAWRFPGLAFWGAVLLSLLAWLPVVQLLVALWSPAPEIWAQVRPQVPGLFSNSLVLVAGVVLGSGCLGTGLAWLTARCEFPGRHFFSWALLLPLAIPAYVLGFVMVGLFDANSPAYGIWLLLQGEASGFPNIRSLVGLTISLSLSFYPYAYLPARHAFQNQGGRAMEMARSLGLGPFRAFFRVALPASLPWIGVGLTLVAMETLADIGTVSVFRYETLATAIYHAWSGASSLAVAAQWAGFLLLLACALLVLEQRFRRCQARNPSPAYDGGLPQTPVLNVAPNFAAFLCAALVLGLAFIIPVWQLLVWGLGGLFLEQDPGFAEAVLHSVFVAAYGAVLIVVATLVLSLARRHYRGADFLVWLATLGYALPGAVVALGILVPVAALDNRLAEFVKSQYNVDLSSLLAGGLGILLLAYLIRFLALGFGPADRAWQKVTQNLVETAHSLDVHGLDLWRQVHWPLLRGGLLGALLLVFVEIIRELPVMLLLRPAGWDTLALHIFDMAQAGQWQRAGLPGLMLVLAGLPQIFFLVRGAGFRHG